MMVEAFSNFPNELKTVEIDAEKGIFKINGEDFGNMTTGFTIECEAGKGFKIWMNINHIMRFQSYKMNGDADG